MSGNLKAEAVIRLGTQKFKAALKGAQIEELEYICGKIGFGVIFQRVASGGWFRRDLFEIIRLGLIGGGMDIDQADEVADLYCQAPLNGEGRAEQAALTILAATMVGLEDIPPLGEPTRPDNA